jgi:DNA polymerase-3 subunit delta'
MIELHEIIGQDSAIGRLQQNISANRLPHAFLFTGPIGVGRRTTAIALAKLLLCENPQSGEGGLLAGDSEAPETKRPCGKCKSCTLMDSETHPDFQLVYKELARFHDDAAVRNRVMQDLGIDVVRKFLLDPVALASSYGRGKIFIVLESELMSIAAQNSLLKTLEEPPPGVVIILITQRDQQLLPTTRSRCSLIRFNPLPHDFVVEKLIADGIAQEQADFWAVFSDGSIGRSIRLSQMGMYDIKCDILQKLASLGRGGDAKLGEEMAKTSDKLAENAVKDAKKKDDAVLSKKLATRRTTGTILEIIASGYSDAMVLRTGADKPLVNSDQLQTIQTLAGKFSPTELGEIIEQLSQFERLLWRNVNPKIVWDNVVITCASAAQLQI